MRVFRVDAVPDEADAPFELGIDDRALDQLLSAQAVVSPLEPPLTIGVAQQRQVVAFGRRRGAACQQCRISISSAVAVLAADFDRARHLAHDQAAAVAVLLEMTIGALHALLGVDVHQVDRLARVDAWRNERTLALLAPFLGIVGADDLAVGIEQVALAVALEHPAEVPAVAVVVGELGVL